jgi:hypothetical protein
MFDCHWQSWKKTKPYSRHVQCPEDILDPFDQKYICITIAINTVNNGRSRTRRTKFTITSTTAFHHHTQ